MKRRDSYSPLKLSTAVAAASMLLGPQSYAQEVVLEEVIVVAQKREQSVQDVPLSVSVVDGQTLENFAINNATDLARSIPGLTILPAPQGLVSPKIRGLGTGTGSESMDQSVGLFIDGVWSGRARDLQASIFDINRIEVIKGTQTSQLGKNTSLGAVLVMTRRPEDKNGGYVEGQYDFELGSTLLTGVGNLATGAGDYRLAINYVDEQGYVDNELAGGEGPKRGQLTARLGGSWDIGDRHSLFISYTYDDLEVTNHQFEVDSDPLGWYTSVSGDDDVRLNNKGKSLTTYRDNGKPYDHQESHRALVEYSYDMGEATEFVSLTGYGAYDNKRYYDSDLSAAVFLDQFKDSTYKQFSQEFRITSRAFADKLDYVAGIYYLNSTFENYEETATLSNLDYVPVAPPLVAAVGPAFGTSDFKQDVESWSVFANGTYQLAEKWALTLGLRYTDETRDATWGKTRPLDESNIYLNPAPGDYIPLPGAPTLYSSLTPVFPPTDMDRSEGNLDGSINLQYGIGSVGIVYLSWAKGSKSGGFDTQASTPEDAEFDTEVAKTTELGVKTELLNGRARLNGAIFYTVIDNFQSVVFVGDGFLSETIPVETRGVEFEGLWAATESLTLGLAATFADAKNTDTDLKPPGSPEWTASFTLAHVAAVGTDFQVLTNAAVNYRDDMYSLGDETYEVPSLTLVDLRVALAPVTGNWELAVMARNLFDEQENNFGFGFPLFGDFYGTTVGSYNRPRTVWLQARYNF